MASRKFCPCSKKVLFLQTFFSKETLALWELLRVKWVLEHTQTCIIMCGKHFCSNATISVACNWLFVSLKEKKGSAKSHIMSMHQLYSQWVRRNYVIESKADVCSELNLVLGAYQMLKNTQGIKKKDINVEHQVSTNICGEICPPFS